MRPPVEIQKRKAPTLKQQVEVLLKQASCFTCGAKLRETGHEYDHMIPLAIGGKNEASNFYCLCPECHAGKTKADMVVIAKTKRRERAAETGKGRKGSGKKLQGRGFAGSRKFNGEVKWKDKT